MPGVERAGGRAEPLRVTVSFSSVSDPVLVRLSMPAPSCSRRSGCTRTVVVPLVPIATPSRRALRRSRCRESSRPKTSQPSEPDWSDDRRSRSRSRRASLCSTPPSPPRARRLSPPVRAAAPGSVNDVAAAPSTQCGRSAPQSRWRRSARVGVGGAGGRVAEAVRSTSPGRVSHARRLAR